MNVVILGENEYLSDYFEREYCSEFEDIQQQKIRFQEKLKGEIVIEKFKVIDCENYIYIAREDRYCSGMGNYLFDGQTAETTNKDKWYKLSKIPTEVLEKKPDERVNKRYELKAGYQPTELMPSVITMEMYESEEYEDVIGLYTLKYDTQWL